MSTPGGLPYPDSTDDLNQGANDVKALAEALSARGLDRFVQTGLVVVHFEGANGTLNFPVPFAAGSKPVVALSGNVPNTIVFLAAGSPSATSLALTLYRLWPPPSDLLGAATDVTVSFIAVGPK